MRLIVILGLVIAGGLLLVPARTTYRHYKEKHSLSLARQFFSNGDYPSAVLAARQTLAVNATNVEACRIMAEIADISQSPVTLDWRRQLAEIAPTVENRLQLAEAGLRYQSPPYPLATQIMVELSWTAATNVAFFHVVIAEGALAQRQLAVAQTELATAVRLNPTNRLYQLNLAAVRLSSAEAATLALARTQLKSFLADTNFAPVALRALITDRLTHDDAPAARSYSETLLKLPAVTLADRLQHLAILQKIPGADFSGQLAAVQLTATNAATVFQVATWLQANGQAAAVGPWLARLPAALGNQPTVQLAQANALEAQQDWAALRHFSNLGKWEELDFMRFALLSRAWAQLGETSVAQGNWRSAVDAAGNRLGALCGLLELTSRWKMAAARQDLFWLLLQKFPRERWVSAALEQQCINTGDTAGLWRIYEQLAAAFPNNPGFNNNYAYISLLLRKNPVEAENLAARLFAQSPTDAGIVSTYAFAQHLRGRDAEALAVMQRLNPSALQQPALVLHYGILLAATGRAAEAKPFLARARTGSGLLPEERRLLDQVLVKP